VLQLDPKTLASHGATMTGDRSIELSAQQYYVCIQADAREALWVPLFPGPGTGRSGIPAEAKSGYVHWTRNSSFYDPGCVCRVGHKGAQRAADAAYDRSSPKSPNRLAPAQVPARALFPPDDKFTAMSAHPGI
jgi:hypothetical protein